MISRLFPAIAVVFILAAPAALRADIDRAHAPAPLPEPKASFPEYKELTLPNGLKVFVVENHREPTITFRLLIKAGDAFDGPRTGLAGFVASLLNRGTVKRSATQFAEETDFLGASVEAGSGQDALSVSASGLTKDIPKLLDLFTDAALHPTFPADELAKLQRQAISSLVESKQRPATLASRLRGKLLFGAEHPYGAYETEESVGALQRDALVKFHHDYFSPDNATLAVVGDVRADDILKQVGEAFAGWKVAEGDTAHQPTFPDLPAAPKEVRVHLVDRPGSVQSNILVCGRGVPRNNADVPEMGVLNAILGGGSSGRLFTNLREHHGYTYGAYSNFSMNRMAGIFSASAEVRNAVTVPAIEEILNEIRRIGEQPVPDPELGMQREYLAGNYLLSLESAMRTAERVQDIDFYKLPANYFLTYASRVEAVTPEKVKSLAAAHLDPNAMTVVVVGEAKDIAKELEKIGPVTVYDTDLKAKTP